MQSDPLVGAAQTELPLEGRETHSESHQEDALRLRDQKDIADTEIERQKQALKEIEL